VSERNELKIDWLTLILYVMLVGFGWMNIYAASSTALDVSILNTQYGFGKQFIWILLCGGLAAVILMTETKLVELFAFVIYGICIAGLIGVLLFGREVNSSRSWFEIGSFRLQPSEFAKVGTALALAKYMSRYNFSFDRMQQRLVAIGIIALPALLILLQRDTGTALVFSSFIFMFFREGLAPRYLILIFLLTLFGVLALVLPQLTVQLILLGLVVFSYIFLFRLKAIWLHVWLLGILGVEVLGIDFFVNYILLPHQQIRLVSLFNPSVDPMGAGWNITQSKIAIGSGGLFGKGYLEGTQTKFDFVPQQDTDFIFCTVGEEWGWIGSILLLIAFFLLIYQVLTIAENSRTRFARVYGYCVASLFFFHVAINIGMTIGFAPVIGIPLPFFSYGGSSLIAFTMMLFLLLNLYANRLNVLSNEPNK